MDCGENNIWKKWNKKSVDLRTNQRLSNLFFRDYSGSANSFTLFLSFDAGSVPLDSE